MTTTLNPEHYTYEGPDAPLNIGVTPQSRAINIQSATDDEALGAFGNCYWISAGGERFATVVGNSYDSPNGDIAIYTSDTPFGSGDNGLSNRFEIKAGMDQTPARFYDLNRLDLIGKQPDVELKPTGSITDVDTRLWWSDHTGTRRWAFRRRGKSRSQLSITSLDGPGDMLSFEPSGVINAHRKPIGNAVWNHGESASRPPNPTQGQRYFDNDLGQPVWFHNGEWVDALGEPAYSTP